MSTTIADRSVRPSGRPVTRSVGAALILACLAGCASVPPPAPVPAPPAQRPATGTPAPSPTPAAPRADFRIDREPMIDVGLAWELDSLVATPIRAVTLASRRPDSEGFGSVPAGNALRIRSDDSRWTLRWRNGDGEPREREIAPAETVWVVAEDRAGNEPTLRWAEKSWRGSFKIFANERGSLTLVARLPLETYLFGVVPGEIGGLSEALLEAGRAQAIAARSYTLFYRGRRGSEGFDVYASVEDQVYGPVEGERPLATRCVESTRGQVVLSEGGPIRANYSSTCGGITAEVWEAWPENPLPYLVSHRDAGVAGDHCAQSSQYRWREEWSADLFLALVATYGPPDGIALPAAGMGRLIDARVESRSRSGRVWRLVVETTTGHVAIPAHALRRVLRRPAEPHPILRSNLLKLDVRRDPATRTALAVVASGAGSGHGVGLCQTGAIGMARRGISGEAILGHYYRRADLRRLYD